MGLQRCNTPKSDETSVSDLSPHLTPPPPPQRVSRPSAWRSPASRRTCSGCWSAACSSPTWPSTPGSLGRSWAGRTPPCCAPSAPTSDSCSWDPRPGGITAPFTRRSLTSRLAPLSLFCQRELSLFCHCCCCCCFSLFTVAGFVLSLVCDLISGTGSDPSHGACAESGTVARTLCSPPGTAESSTTCREGRGT